MENQLTRWLQKPRNIWDAEYLGRSKDLKFKIEKLTEKRGWSCLDGKADSKKMIYLSNSKNANFDALLSNVSTQLHPENFDECPIKRSESSILVSCAEETKL